MKKTAFLYAGQGSQHKGMGKDLYEKYPEFREVFDNADVDFDLKEVCFEDSQNEIGLTRYTQPCMVAFACGMTKILQNKGIKPDILAGLSLGEYSALNAAGVWDEKETIKLARFRGNAMTRSAKGVESSMCAVMGLDRDALEDCTKKVSDSGQGIVSICNDNCPGQIVIGGEKKAVEACAELAKEKGAKRCVPLNVSGPFHTAFMKEAGDELEEYFKKIEFRDEQIPVVFNLTGKEKSSDETVQSLLKGQVQNGVKMTQTLNYMLDKGVKRFVEIGPGKALTGFVKRCAKEKGITDIECVTLETCEDVESFIMSIQ